MEKDKIIEAHQFCKNNKESLLNSKKCGCFYCLKIFNSNEIEDWVDGGITARCPHCGIDSIISENTKFPITEKFLKEMKKYWF